MKKTIFKKTISTLLVISFMCSILSFNVFAYSGDVANNSQENGDSTILYAESGKGEPRYVPCPVFSGKHQMQGRATGSLILNGKQIFIGYANQCLYCDDVIVSEYSPHYNTKLGRYGYWNPGYQVGNNVVMYTNVMYTNYSLKNDVFFESFYWL